MDESTRDRIADVEEDDEDRAGRLLGRERGRRGAGDEDIDLEPNQVADEIGKPLVPSFPVLTAWKWSDPAPGVGDAGAALSQAAASSFAKVTYAS